MTRGPAPYCLGATAVITAASGQAPPYGRPVQGPVTTERPVQGPVTIQRPVQGPVTIERPAPGLGASGRRPSRGRGTSRRPSRGLRTSGRPVGMGPAGEEPAGIAPAVRERALTSNGGRSPATYGRPVPPTACAEPVTAPLALAPALPHPPGTVRHVPDLFGAVLLACAVAAGVLAISRGCAWGRLSPRPGAVDATCPSGTAVPPPASGGVAHGGGHAPGAGDRHDRVPVADPPSAVPLAATALVRVAVASGHETGPRSQRAAEGGPAWPRRLPAGPRGLTGNSARYT